MRHKPGKMSREHIRKMSSKPKRLTSKDLVVKISKNRPYGPSKGNDTTQSSWTRFWWCLTVSKLRQCSVSRSSFSYFIYTFGISTSSWLKYQIKQSKVKNTNHTSTQSSYQNNRLNHFPINPAPCSFSYFNFILKCL